MRKTARWTLRILAGFAATPVATAVIAVGAYDLFWHAGLTATGVPVHSLDSAVSLGAGVFILAVPTTGVGALGVIWLSHRRWLTLGRLLLFGAIVGNLPFAMIVAGVFAMNAGVASREVAANWHGLFGALTNIAMGVIVGAGGAATFWLVSLCGTTDGAGRPTLPLGAS
jgi:hypothetical protein